MVHGDARAAADAAPSRKAREEQAEPMLGLPRGRGRMARAACRDAVSRGSLGWGSALPMREVGAPRWVLRVLPSLPLQGVHWCGKGLVRCVGC